MYNIGMINLTITENQGNQRLDRFLKKYFDGAPLSRIYKMIRKDIKINGRRGKEDTLLLPGDQLTLYITESEAASMQKPKKIIRVKRQFKIAYEDENIIVVEKPFGLLTHGDRTEKKNHLANQVIDYLIETGAYQPRLDKTFSPAPANRLDRNTTGLVVFGKNAAALQELNRMIRQKDAVRKLYMTIVSGNLKEKVTLHAAMTKDEKKNLVHVFCGESGENDKNVPEGSKEMETIASPVRHADYCGTDYTLTEVEIVTGRTHQIRAHLAAAGCPVIGDVKYGSRKVNQMAAQKFGLHTQLLHAYKLIFEKCDEEGALAYLQGKVVTAQLPDEFKRIEETIFGNNEKGGKRS